MPAEFPRTGYAGNSVCRADGRSYGREVSSHGPGAIRPGLCGLPGISLLGISVNRDVMAYSSVMRKPLSEVGLMASTTNNPLLSAPLVRLALLRLGGECETPLCSG